jgi:hypothetical protein
VQTFDEPQAHNPVLIRTHEPKSKSGWLMPTLLAATLLLGAAVWVYVEIHPSAPIVNHAVEPAAATTGSG